MLKILIRLLWTGVQQKDDVIEKGLSKSAFEQIVEKKTLDNINTNTPTSTSIASLRNNQNNKSNNNSNYPVICNFK